MELVLTDTVYYPITSMVSLNPYLMTFRVFETDKHELFVYEQKSTS